MDSITKKIMVNEMIEALKNEGDIEMNREGMGIIIVRWENGDYSVKTMNRVTGVVRWDDKTEEEVRWIIEKYW